MKNNSKNSNKKLTDKSKYNLDNKINGNSNGDTDSAEPGGLYSVSITFGLINLALVGLCYLIKIAVIGAGLILFFLLGFYADFLAFKDAFSEKSLKGFLQSSLGLAINIGAAVLYLLVIKSSLSL